jgi:hypothetical protein
MQQPGRLELSLQACTLEGELQIVGTQTPQELDDAVATEVGRIRHRRSPVALDAARVLLHQPRMPRHQRAHRFEVVAADRIGHPAREHEPRPARHAVAPRERMLRIGQPRVRRIDRPRMVTTQLVDGVWLAAPDGAEQITRLMLQLIEVRPDGKMASGHTSLLICARCPPVRAKGGSG